MKILQVCLKTLLTISLAIFVFSYIGSFFITVNSTPSFPRGIYININKIPQKHDLVRFCPEPTTLFETAKKRRYVSVGFCPGGYGTLIKKILAAKGDTVEFTLTGVFVNSILLDNSIPKFKDSQGHSMPIMQGKYVLAENDVLLMSDYHPDSFDARYFGIQSIINIQTVLQPFKVWEEENETDYR